MITGRIKSITRTDDYSHVTAGSSVVGYTSAYPEYIIEFMCDEIDVTMGVRDEYYMDATKNYASNSRNEAYRIALEHARAAGHDGVVTAITAAVLGAREEE